MTSEQGSGWEYGTLASRLQDHEPVLGLLVTMPSPVLVDLAGAYGLDFVVLDAEHGPGDHMLLAHHLSVARAADIPALVRVATREEIAKALDLGATGIVAPHVSSVADARALVEAAHYAPGGRRGFATATSAARFGSVPAADHHARSADTTVVVAMIEDPDGVAAAEHIAAVPGVTALLVGPADLACSLGGLPPVGARLAALTAQVHDAARRAGVAVMSIASGSPDARARLAQGDDAVVYSGAAVLGAMVRDLAGARPASHAARAVAATKAREDDPLVLLPGMLGDAAVWDGVAALLADERAVRVERIDLDDSVAALAASVLAAAPARFALAGHSLGGIVALEIVRQAPGRVTRLALLNTSARPASPEQLAAWETLRTRVEAEEFAQVACELAEGNLPEQRRHDAELIRLGERSALAIGAAGFLRQLAAQASRPDSGPTLSSVSVPTLVITGAIDRVCPPHLQEELADAIPQAELVVLEGVGHMAPVEAPEVVAAHLGAWLRRGWR